MLSFKIIKKKILLSWLWVILCSIAIYALIPLGNRIQKFISDYLGKKFFIYFILAVLGFVFIGLIYSLIYRLRIRSLPNYIWLLVLAGFYIHLTLKLRNSPVEVTHFLEYGVLSILLFRALNHHIKDKTIYFNAALIILLIGTLDEIIQWIVPGRVWNFKDVKLNVISGGLIQLAIWQVIGPRSISEKINPKSLKIFSYVFSSCLIILGLCVSNTPNRVYHYTQKIPWLSFLQKEEPMSEFGYKHKDLEIGAFYSRLSLKSLQKRDNLKGEHYAQILNESVNKNYEQFLREYSPITDPFMHELRVHIFRRDTYFEKGKSTLNLNDKKESYFITYKENLILEKYFKNSIEKSVYRWDEDTLRESKELIDKSKHYESPVSANLFTSFSEKTVWTVIFSVIFLLVIVNLIFPYIKKMRRLSLPLDSQ